ncbi:Alpha/Beta hydrolase protein [Chytridium lagenaria]|nr:Alpha/Beta hydrolase protein [Chytridium lagenaria]
MHMLVATFLAGGLLIAYSSVSKAAAAHVSSSKSLSLPAKADPSYIPIVIWHGMGDSCNNPDSMGYIQGVINETLPGVYVHSICLGDTEDDDRSRGFFDLVENQVESVCTQLSTNPFLLAHPRIHAIGFSQGGQFLRSFVERCNFPKVHTLVTFGSQHLGVADAPGCTKENDGVGRSYWPWVQRRSVQAQYFRDPRNIARYLEKSLFLAAANNEVPDRRNVTFKKNLASLEKFVLIKFSEEETVVPAESSWFGYYDENMVMIPMREQPIYKEDWIGIRELDEQGKLIFLEAEGRHMGFSREFFEGILVNYLNVTSEMVEMRDMENEMEGGGSDGDEESKKDNDVFVIQS